MTRTIKSTAFSTSLLTKWGRDSLCFESEACHCIVYLFQAAALVEEETRRYRPTKNYLSYLATPDFAAFEVRPPALTKWKHHQGDELVHSIAPSKPPMMIWKLLWLQLCVFSHVFRRRSWGMSLKGWALGNHWSSSAWRGQVNHCFSLFFSSC